MAPGHLSYQMELVDQTARIPEYASCRGVFAGGDQPPYSETSFPAVNNWISGEDQWECSRVSPRLCQETQLFTASIFFSEYRLRAQQVYQKILTFFLLLWPSILVLHRDNTSCYILGLAIEARPNLTIMKYCPILCQRVPYRLKGTGARDLNDLELVW